ncbi:MAG: hypothetical protein U9P44_02620, partial [archaeon]|nr:hypothetical protein [archaeon]
FDQKEFDEFVLDNNVIGFFEEPVTLKSKRESHWYVNWRDVAGDVFLIDKLTDYIIAFAEDAGLEPDCFYGVPEGATKLGVLAQFKWARLSADYTSKNYCLPMGRGKPKDHGAPKDRYFIGKPQGKTIILEDVTTTGGSLLETIDNLAEADISMIAAFGLTNRMELRDDRKSVRQAVEARQVPYFALSNALDLLPQAYDRQDPGYDIGKAVEDEFEMYGVEKLRLI